MYMYIFAFYKNSFGKTKNCKSTQIYWLNFSVSFHCSYNCEEKTQSDEDTSNFRKKLMRNSKKKRHFSSFIFSCFFQKLIFIFIFFLKNKFNKIIKHSIHFTCSYTNIQNICCTFYSTIYTYMNYRVICNLYEYSMYILILLIVYYFYHTSKYIYAHKMQYVTLYSWIK